MNVGQEVTGEANRGPEGLSKRGTHVGGGGVLVQLKYWALGYADSHDSIRFLTALSILCTDHSLSTPLPSSAPND